MISVSPGLLAVSIPFWIDLKGTDASPVAASDPLGATWYVVAPTGAVTVNAASVAASATTMDRVVFMWLIARRHSSRWSCARAACWICAGPGRDGNWLLWQQRLGDRSNEPGVGTVTTCRGN